MPGPGGRTIGSARAAIGVGMLLAVALPAHAATYRVAWDPSPSPQLAGYVIRYGPAPGIYTASVDVGVRLWSTLELPDGQIVHAAVFAYDGLGIVSAASNEILVGPMSSPTVPPSPSPSPLPSPSPPVSLPPTSPSVEVCGDGIDNDGDGSVDTGCTGSDPSAAWPGAPSRLTAAVTGTRVALHWLAPIAGMAPTGYVVEAGAVPDGAVVRHAVGAQTSWSVDNVPAGRYHVRVRAVHGTTPGRPSNETVVTVGCPGPPRAPQSLAAAVNGSRLSLQWTDPDGCSETRYRVSVGSRPGAADLAMVIVSEPRAIAAAPAGTYHLQVASLTSRGVSTASGSLQVTVGSAGCRSPNPQLTLSGQIDGRRVQLDWKVGDPTSVEDADAAFPLSYRLEVGSVPGSADLGVFAVGRTTRFVAEAPPGRYAVRVVPADSCRSGTPSNVLILHVP